MDLKKKVYNMIKGKTYERQMRAYRVRFGKYAFTDCKCETKEQFEASIIRLYHTIEKGLSYTNYRAGFGQDNIEKLIITLEQYAAKGLDTTSFAYETALSCLYKYIEKNKAYGLNDIVLEKRIHKLSGKANEYGGTIEVSHPCGEYNYEQLMKQRHSIRHFADKPVDINTLKSAIELAQYTPSACNRQGWKTRIISDKELIIQILSNQNGNRGFGQEFDKLLIVTADLRAQQKSRELFQAFVDGGMYAESVLNALYYYGVGSCPLSAALTMEQEKNIRNITKINEAELFILFIGVGNYPGQASLTTRSQRKPIDIEVIGSNTIYPT